MSRWGALVLLFLFLSGLTLKIFAQEIHKFQINGHKNQTNFTIIKDSLWVSNPDSLKQLLFKTDSVHLRILFVNDHNWNNWALDTIITVLPDSSFNKRLIQKKPYHLPFKPVSLKEKWEMRKPWFRRYLKPGLATLALLSNWGSFYFKRVADDHYKKYHATSSLPKMNYYYNKTLQFDHISNVFLAVSVVSISVYLYLLLK